MITSGGTCPASYDLTFPLREKPAGQDHAQVLGDGGILQAPHQPIATAIHAWSRASRFV